MLFGIVFVIAACATSKIDLTPEAAQSHYENGRAAMIAGYQKDGNPIALEYPAWKSAVTAPAIPGVHGKRYLVTYVNDTGYETYVELASQNVESRWAQSLRRRVSILEGSPTLRRVLYS